MGPALAFGRLLGGLELLPDIFTNAKSIPRGEEKPRAAVTATLDRNHHL